jgi:hypothetical protein
MGSFVAMDTRLVQASTLVSGHPQSVTKTLLLGAAPTSTHLVTGGVYRVRAEGRNPAHTILLRVAESQVLAETIAAPLTTAADHGGPVFSGDETVDVFVPAGSYIGAQEDASTAVRIFLTCIRVIASSSSISTGG